MSKIDPEKLQKVWKLVKTIIELILASLVGAAVGSCHFAVTAVAQLLP